MPSLAVVGRSTSSNCLIGVVLDLTFAGGHIYFCVYNHVKGFHIVQVSCWIGRHKQDDSGA